MLLDENEIGLINRSIIRKTSEVARVFMDNSMSIAVRNSLACNIGRNLVRLQSLRRIGNNDFSNIKNDYEILSSEDYFISLNNFSYYEGFLSESNKDDEGQLRAIDALVWDFLPLLQKSIELSDLIRKGYNVLLDSDLNSYVCTKKFFISCKSKYIVSDFEDYTPYLESKEYLDYMIEQCSVMIRIGTYKNVTNKEISDLIDQSYDVSSESFEALCLPEMSVKDKERYTTFKILEEDRLSIAISKAINNSYLEIKN